MFELVSMTKYGGHFFHLGEKLEQLFSVDSIYV